MEANNFFFDYEEFSARLYSKMQQVSPGIVDLELYEFRYALENLITAEGWKSIQPSGMDEIESMVHDIAFYESIQLRPANGKSLMMDRQIQNLTQMLFYGLVLDKYPVEWINQNFYFDIRGFYFLHRTTYYTSKIIEHLGGQPWRRFTNQRHRFDHIQGIGYKDFQKANTEVDESFLGITQTLVEKKGTPLLLAIAGQTAAGKTEIVSRLREAFKVSGKMVTSIELDNFLMDRDYREERGIDSRGREALHYELFIQALEEIRQGNPIAIPRYDFLNGTSSHDPNGRFKPGCSMIKIDPADVIFMEGNFPFLLPEIAKLINIKVLYLTDDDIRLKRKWKRDMDYRKKYDLMYLINRYFREQFIMAEEVYRPQMEICDLVVDTSNAMIWATPEIQKVLDT